MATFGITRNANLCSIISGLELKMDCSCTGEERLKILSTVANFVS